MPQERRCVIPNNCVPTFIFFQLEMLLIQKRTNEALNLALRAIFYFLYWVSVQERIKKYQKLKKRPQDVVDEALWFMFGLNDFIKALKQRVALLGRV